MVDSPLIRVAMRYANAKRSRDVGAALAACAEDVVLDAVSLNVRAVGRQAVRRQLEAFFACFPDYEAELEGRAAGEGVVILWGRERGTFERALGPIRPTRRRAEYRFLSMYQIRQGLLVEERYFVDLAGLCKGGGIPAASLAALLGTEADERNSGAERRGVSPDLSR